MQVLQALVKCQKYFFLEKFYEIKIIHKKFGHKITQKSIFHNKCDSSAINRFVISTHVIGNF